MDWGLIITNALRAAVGLDTVVFALAAIGLNVHFGYTGLLNFGQSAFLAVAGYGLAITVAEFELPTLLGRRSSACSAPSCSRCCSASRRCGCAPTTSPSSPSRRPRSCGCSSGRCRCRSTPAAPTGSAASPTGFYSINPFPDGALRHRPGRLQRAGDVGAHRRLDARRARPCVLVFLLMRSPWGRVLKAIREDEDAVRSLGKNVYSYKMQSLVLGGVLGCLAGFVYGLGQRRDPARLLRHRDDVLRLHDRHPRRRGPGASARSSVR